MVQGRARKRQREKEDTERAIAEAEQRRQRDKAEAEANFRTNTQLLETCMERFITRRQPLGLDRYGRKYWWDVGGQRAVLMVEEADGSAWAAYTSPAEVQALIASLQLRGVRECELRRSLEALLPSITEAMAAAKLPDAPGKVRHLPGAIVPAGFVPAEVKPKNKSRAKAQPAPAPVLEEAFVEDEEDGGKKWDGAADNSERPGLVLSCHVHTRMSLLA